MTLKPKNIHPLCWPLTISGLICISCLVMGRFEKPNQNDEALETATKEVGLTTTEARAERLTDEEYRVLMLEQDQTIKNRYHSVLDDSIPDVNPPSWQEQWDEKVQSIRTEMRKHANGKGNPRSVYSQMEKELITLLQDQPKDPDSLK